MASVSRPTMGDSSKHQRSKSSGILRSIVVPKNASRMSREITSDQLRDRNPNTRSQQMPLLPPDHPHSKAAGSENVDPSTRRGRADTVQEKPVAQKRSKSTVSLRSLVTSDEKRERKDERKKEKKEKSPKKPIKTKSSTGLSAMFAKMNKSSKDLTETGPEKTRPHSISPPASASGSIEAPIWAQFATLQTDVSMQSRSLADEIDLYTPKAYLPSEQRNFQGYGQSALSRPTSSSRPQSMIATDGLTFGQPRGRRLSGDRSQLGSRGSDSSRLGLEPTQARGRTSMEGRRPNDLTEENRKSSAEQPAPAKGLTVTKRGTKVMAAVAAWNGKAKEPSSPNKDLPLDPKAVDAAFEAVLDARNVPENMRQKMRSLTLHVKADFVKQENSVSRPSSPTKSATWSEPSPADTRETNDSPVDAKQPTDDKGEDGTATKRSRPRSKTFTFTKGDSSPSKKQKASERPKSIHGAEQVLTQPTTPTAALRSASRDRRAPRSYAPSEYVEYLRKEKDPKQSEVGRLHKLRLLLRNETVAWVDSFIELGGMTEIAGLLHRIMAIEWREEHEDQLLHETLLCLKGICTTSIALKRLDELADGLFPPLLSMLFDEEKKGPAEFNARGVIFAILFSYLEAASQSGADTAESRAQKIASYVSDPKKPEEAQPVSFVLDMQQTRPYRVWCKEVNGVSREVFWIFLHNLNVIPLPGASRPTSSGTTDALDSSNQQHQATGDSHSQSYTGRHFPCTRPPVPAAPYIGGVEWDATTYITTHLDLLNGIIACLPTPLARNSFREEVKASGFEKVMGATLRTCKEKFYGSVHDALRAWVAAADEDGWDTRFVRQGPSREEIAERAMAAVAASPKKGPVKDAAPRLEAPKVELGGISLGFGNKGSTDKGDDDGWLA